MINVTSKRCEHIGCKTCPVFDSPGGKGRFCVLHKQPDMIDVITRRCEFTVCNKLNPVFDSPGGKGRFCVLHKLPGMINVKDTICEEEHCKKRPSFDIPGGKGKFCNIHKRLGMINIKNIRCNQYECQKRPTFDFPGEKGRFCIEHKQLGMIDVKHQLCENNDCNIRACYGKPGSHLCHCAKHRQPGMIRRSNGKCKIKSCGQPAIYGINYIPIYCETHKTDNQTNYVEQECMSCHLSMILNKSNMCEFCEPKTFSTGRLVKQNALMDYLNINGLLGTTTDMMIEGGICGKERPDRVYEFGDKIICLEVDEHQHRDRACECEQTRMVNIGQSFGGTPVYFIRWNPDEYRPANSHKEPKTIQKRHKLVADFIKGIRDGNVKLPKALVSAIYLYYDDWDCLYNTKWEILTAFVDSHKNKSKQTVPI